MNKNLQGAILGIMCLVLTIGICVQVKTVNNNGSTINGNEEINSLKSQILKTKEKYEVAYEKLEKVEKELEKTRESIASNSQDLKELDEEIKKANLLLGLTDVKGTGVKVTITDAPTNPLIPAENLIVHDIDVLEVVNELKNAGAEAIEVNGQRIVNTTAISCAGTVISINGERVSSPFTINAIGMPEIMATLKRVGGYLEILEEQGITTSFEKKNKIAIPKYSGVINFKYAKTIKK